MLCEDGQGDCDTDADCVTGTTCGYNVGLDWGFAEDVDVCEAPGIPTTCSAAAPCGEGQGDCDLDSHCMSGLICVTDVGANYALPPMVDVCETASSGP
jgi:hypothetical protein